jgi:SAM-dependent methyltransferase
MGVVDGAGGGYPFAGSNAFRVAVGPYDRMVGRYSEPLAPVFADAAGVTEGQRALDIGCGPGALTTELVRRLGAEHVAAVEPSTGFASECRRRNPGADVRIGPAELLPFADASFDVVLAQLVFNFFSDAGLAATEMRRVLAPGGIAGGCVWQIRGGMEALEALFAAARTAGVEPPAGPGSRFTQEGEIGVALREAGFRDVESGALEVTADYDDVDDLWAALTSGVGPQAGFVEALTRGQRHATRAALPGVLGTSGGPLSLKARAWYATGRA